MYRFTCGCVTNYPKTEMFFICSLFSGLAVRAGFGGTVLLVSLGLVCLQLAECLSGAGWSRAASLTRLAVGSLLAGTLWLSSMWPPPASWGLFNRVTRKITRPPEASAQKSDHVTATQFIGQSKGQRLSTFRRRIARFHLLLGGVSKTRGPCLVSGTKPTHSPKDTLSYSPFVPPLPSPPHPVLILSPVLSPFASPGASFSRSASVS